MKRPYRQVGLSATVLAGLVICSSTGCGGKLPNAAPVSGTVLYDGKPLEGATVTFRSQSEEGMVGGGLALGTTDSNGKFTLQSHLGPKDVAKGVVPGDYRVSISKFVPPNGMSDSEYEQKRADEAKVMEADGIVPPDKQVPPKIELLAAIYSDTKKTTLKATIPEGGDQDLKFELK